MIHGSKAWISVRGKNHLFAPVLIISAKKKKKCTATNMALSLFKILTIFGNFAKGCDSFFFLKWLKRLILHGRIFYFFLVQSKQHLSKRWDLLYVYDNN